LIKPAVFLDRDGTINEQMGYVNDLCRFVLLPHTAEAIRMLNEHDYWTIIISNQSGVARGYFPIDLVHSVHARMQTLLAREGAHVDGIYFCPHYPGARVEAFGEACNCRKPRPGLIEKACREFKIDLPRSYMVGDRYTDMELAGRMNLTGILVMTGYGKGDLKYIIPRSAHKPHHVAQDLLDAVKWILQR